MKIKHLLDHDLKEDNPKLLTNNDAPTYQLWLQEQIISSENKEQLCREWNPHNGTGLEMNTANQQCCFQH